MKVNQISEQFLKQLFSHFLCSFVWVGFVRLYVYEAILFLCNFFSGVCFQPNVRLIDFEDREKVKD